MSRIEWSRLYGDETEEVIAIMLCRRFPDARRVRAAQGDGGIDVIVPEADGHHVYQVKRYAPGLDATRKRHIEQSWQALSQFREKTGLQVSEWSLVTPVVSTHNQYQWLLDVTEDPSVLRHWKGMEFVDGLAADFPDVIDYYLRDGKERLQGYVERLFKLSGQRNPVADAAEAARSIEELHRTLNELDPHFVYDFAVDTVPSGGALPPVEDRPGMVAAAQFVTDTTATTVRVIVRYREALQDRPVPGRFKLVAEVGSDAERQINDWLEFGTPLVGVEAAEVAIDLPGGLGPDHPQTAVISSGPSGTPIEGQETTLSVLSESDDLVAKMHFRTDLVTMAPDGQGMEVHTVDSEAGVLRLRMRIRAGRTEGAMSIDLESPAGKAPGRCLAVAQLIESLEPPNRLQVSLRDGPVLCEPFQLNSPVLEPSRGRLMRLISEALLTLQLHGVPRAAFPDCDAVPAADIDEWLRVAALLRGSAFVGTWEGQEVHAAGDDDPPVEPRPVSVNLPLAVTVDGARIDIGTAVMLLHSAMLDPSVPVTAHEGHQDYRLIPGDIDTAVIRLIGDQSNGNVA